MNDILTKNPLFRLLIRKNSCTTSLSAWNEALLRFAEELAAVSEQLSDYRQLYRILSYTHARLGMLRSRDDRGKKKSGCSKTLFGGSDLAYRCRTSVAG